MDRFKFRVWNNKKNEYEDDLYYEAGDLQVTCVNKVFEEYISDECIIEQCTGLKDKNGKLVYEGDILKGGDKKYRVVWQGSAFVLKIRKAGSYSMGGSVDLLEVIGNIHENADLLGEE